jgi:hypothetical protein
VRAQLSSNKTAAIGWNAPLPDAGHREIYRRRAVWLCLLFVVLLPLEGILRKWVFSSIHQPFVFIRDPVAIGIFANFLLYRSPRVPAWALYWMLAVVAALGLVAIQSLWRPLPLTVYLLGLRNHFLFIPMALAMADLFQAKDLGKLVRLFCYLSVPIAVLVVVQFFSPPGAYINKGISDDVDARVFLVSADIVRTYGPFTFVSGQSSFTALMLAVLIAGFDRHRQWGVPVKLLIMALLAVIVMASLSGSRTTFMFAGIIARSAMISNLTGTPHWR